MKEEIETNPPAAAQCTCYKGGCELHMGVRAWSPPPAAAQRPTPRTDGDDRNYPLPEYAGRIQFEGCECVVVSPEEYEELFEKARTLERELVDAREKIAAQAEQIERQRALLAKIRHPLFSMTRGELCAAINAVLSQGVPSVRDNSGCGEGVRDKSPWLPIETAPKDGTEIIGWREDCGRMLVRWDAPENFLTEREVECLGLSAEQYDWFYADSAQGGRLEGELVPTHWMPLGKWKPAKTAESELEK